ncbi:MAG: hypothetical protein N2111_12295 [Candidatus Sumerlaeaceae bacterium]|nr:hypothetical protein [Candidatus Sumerlaeaceae bacterium]
MAAPSLRSSLRVMLGSEVVLPFIVGSSVLGISGNAVYDILSSWAGGEPVPRAAVWVLVICVVVFSVVAFWLWWRGRCLTAPVAVPVSGQPPQKRRGIIVLVSANPQFVEAGLRAALYHRPKLEFVWLVYTDKSEPHKDTLRARLIEHGLSAANINDCHLSNPLDPMEVFRLVDGIYTRLPMGLETDDVILDFLGLTAVASVGAVMACLRPERPIQYTPQAPDSKALHPADPIEIALTWDLVRPEQPASQPEPPAPGARAA